MPIYEYTCCSCGHDFEALIRNGEAAACPRCSGAELEKQWSVPAAHSASGGELPICSPRPAAGGCGLPQCGGGGCQFDM